MTRKLTFLLYYQDNKDWRCSLHSIQGWETKADVAQNFKLDNDNFIW